MIWSVEKPYYKSKSGSLVLLQNTDLNVSLEIQKYKVIIDPDRDAIISFTAKTVPSGGQVITVGADYVIATAGCVFEYTMVPTDNMYRTQTGTFTVTRDETISLVTAHKEPKVTITTTDTSSVLANYSYNSEWHEGTVTPVSFRKSFSVNETKGYCKINVSFNLYQNATPSPYSDPEFYYKVSGNQYPEYITLSTFGSGASGNFTITVAEGDALEYVGAYRHYQGSSGMAMRYQHSVSYKITKISTTTTTTTTWV